MKQRGFTLLELLIVLALLIAMSALAWPSLSHQLDHRTFESAVEQIEDQLLLARAHAQSTGDPIELIYLPTHRMLQARPFSLGGLETTTDSEQAGAISAAWATNTLPGALELTRHDPFDSHDPFGPFDPFTANIPRANTAVDGDALPDDPIRFLVYLGDGSVILKQSLWLTGSDVHAAAIDVHTWTGLPALVVRRLDEETDPTFASDQDKDEETDSEKFNDFEPDRDTEVSP